MKLFAEVHLHLPFCRAQKAFRAARKELYVRSTGGQCPLAMVHISALERLGKQVLIDGRTQAYEPKNLRAVISQIKAAYSGGKTCSGATDVAVVDWSGEVLQPAEHSARERVLGVLKMAGA
jgi:hypothetical protein